MRTFACILGFLVFFTLFYQDTQAQDIDTIPPKNIYEMDLQALMNMEVTTASKRAQSIDEAPAAVFVITKEDIKYHGFSNVGEAIRLVPGIEVIQGGDQNYEVGIRGFSISEYNTSNKVLWLIDGRSVYNDAYGGVRVESLPISMDDIERIEVIRGAGSSLYGANAYSGIVNIITKKASDQQGFKGAASYGNLNQYNTYLRYGNTAGKLSYKASIGVDNIDKPQKRWDGLSADSISKLQDIGYDEGDINASQKRFGNIIFDYDLAENKSLNFSGGFTSSEADHYYLLPGKTYYNDYFVKTNYSDARNLFRIYYNGSSTDKGYRINRFSKSTDPDPNGDVYDKYLLSKMRKRFQTYNSILVTNQMTDMEYQRTFNIGSKLTNILGGSYRQNFVKANIFTKSSEDTTITEGLSAVFTQFDYRPSEKLSLIIGGRFDNHPIVGNNLNPRVAMIYNVSKSQTLRLNYGTATRNPHFLNSYISTNMKVANLRTATGLDPILNLTTESDYAHYYISGSRSLKAEKFTCYELGYTAQLGENFQIKFDMFYGVTDRPIAFRSAVILEPIENIENLTAIFKSQNPDFTTMSETGIAIGDFTWDDDFNKNDMQSAMDRITQVVNDLLIPGIAQYEAEGNDSMVTELKGKKLSLETLRDSGFVKLMQIYGNPKVLSIAAENGDIPSTLYGGEISLTYIPSKNLTFMANYAYLKITGYFNETRVNVPNSDPQILNLVASPEHKFNLGFKYQIGKLYGGLMFNYMSKKVTALDNDLDGQYDIDDLDPIYGNGALTTIDDRLNMNFNVGIEYKSFDIFFTGLNLIQSDYTQMEKSYAADGGDLLNTRFMAGIKLTL